MARATLDRRHPVAQDELREALRRHPCAGALPPTQESLQALAHVAQNDRMAGSLAADALRDIARSSGDPLAARFFLAYIEWQPSRLRELYGPASDQFHLIKPEALDVMLRMAARARADRSQSYLLRPLAEKLTDLGASTGRPDSVQPTVVALIKQLAMTGDALDDVSWALEQLAKLATPEAQATLVAFCRERHGAELHYWHNSDDYDEPQETRWLSALTAGDSLQGSARARWQAAKEQAGRG
jgi:hypothetical protein